MSTGRSKAPATKFFRLPEMFASPLRQIVVFDLAIGFFWVLNLSTCKRIREYMVVLCLEVLSKYGVLIYTDNNPTVK